MPALWIVVMSALLMIAIDATWRYLERRGVQIGPVRRGGSTIRTTIAVAAIVLVAWILDSAGLLESTISSPGALIAVVLQVAFVLALAVLARNKGRQS